MYKLIKIFTLLSFLLFIFLAPNLTKAQGSSWYWISSDNKFTKYFSPKEVKVIANQNGIPTLIQDYIKTGYSELGAVETIKSMKLNIADPKVLSYSIAKVWVNPQNRTIRYMEETFYTKDNKAIYKNIPKNPRVKPINSQAFDEKFYTYIVDQVYHQGETKYLNSKDRWLTIWDNASGDNAADTSAMYQVKDHVITWLWRNNKEQGKVVSINFVQKDFDIKNHTVRTMIEYKWTPQRGWETIISSPETKMRQIKSGTLEAAEFDKIRSFALRNPVWTCRYQIYNPAIKGKPNYLVETKEVNKEKSQGEKVATTPKKVTPKKDETKKEITKNNLDTYGPIGPVVSR